MKTKEKLSDNHKIHQKYISPITGIEYPGGSTIAGLLDKGFGMVVSAVNLTKKGYDYKKIWDEKREAGTLVHKLIESYLRGEKFDTKDFTQGMIDRAESSFLKFLEWEKKHKIEGKLCEKQMISEIMKAGGTVDMIAEIDGKITLVDYKSGGLYDSSYCQASGYNLIAIENNIHIDRVMLLHIPQNEDEKDVKDKYLTRSQVLYWGLIFQDLCKIYWNKQKLKEEEK